MKITKKSLIDRCREILYKYNDKVTNPDDYNFLIELFNKHPNHTQKIGAGIDYIYVKPNKDFPSTRCFYIYRKDGSFTDISFNECISPSSSLKKIKTACRNSINDIIFQERKKIVFPFTCPITGLVCKSYEDVHIDHYDLTFDQLFNLWVKNKDLEYLLENINESMDNNSITEFINLDISKDFIEFHNRNTHLKRQI